MAVLVTGGAGYIGNHAVLELVDRGLDVVILDDLSTGFRESIPSQAHFVLGDAGDERLLGTVIAEHRIDAIMHFAAKIVVPDSVADPLGYYWANTVKSRALLQAAITGGVKHFIFSSTAAVYGEPATSPVSEDMPFSPINPYGRSKMMTELMLRDAAEAHGLRYVALRYFNVAGADPKERSGQSTPRATHLIKVACQAALGDRPYLEVFGTDYPTPDGSCVRDYIQVTDLARAHVMALQHLQSDGGNLTLNCGYGRGYSVLEVIDVVKRVSGIDFDVHLGGRRPGDPAALVAKADSIRAALGWRPEYEDIEAIVTQAFRWERRLKERQRTAVPVHAGSAAA